MVKHIKNIQEYEDFINNIDDQKYIIKYGIPFCMPCSMLEENLTNWADANNEFSSNIVLISDAQVCSNQGFENVPVLVGVNKKIRTFVKDDSEELLDEDEVNKILTEFFKND